MRVVLPAEAQQAVGVQSASIPPDTSRWALGFVTWDMYV